MEHSLTGFEATIALMSKIDKGILRKENYRLISLMNLDALKPVIYKGQYITTKQFIIEM